MDKFHGGGSREAPIYNILFDRLALSSLAVQDCVCSFFLSFFLFHLVLNFLLCLIKLIISGAKSQEEEEEERLSFKNRKKKKRARKKEMSLEKVHLVVEEKKKKKKKGGERERGFHHTIMS